MSLKTFVDDLNNITEYMERFRIKLYFKSSYYEVVLKLLYVDNILVNARVINILLDDGRVIKLRITDDLKYWIETMRVDWVEC